MGRSRVYSFPLGNLFLSVLPNPPFFDSTANTKFMAVSEHGIVTNFKAVPNLFQGERRELQILTILYFLLQFYVGICKSHMAHMQVGSP